MNRVLESLSRRYQLDLELLRRRKHVLTGRDSRTGQAVFVKFCRDLLPERCEFNVRALRRIRRIRHENVVPLLNYAVMARDCVVHVLGFVEARTALDLLVTSQAGLDRLVALDIVLGSARALAVLHAEGIVHADVAPANILLQDSGVKLTDFDLAIVDEDAERCPKHLYSGTPAYTAPEIAAGERGPSPWSDMYSLGCVYYELLTGELPFEAGSELEALYLHVTATPRDPRRFRPDLSHDECSLLSRLLARRPEQRFPTTDALVNELERLRRGLLHEHRSPGGNTTVG